MVMLDRTPATAREPAGARRAFAWAALILTLAPVAAALVVVVAYSIPPQSVVRLLVTAVVYAPLTALLIAMRRYAVAAITGPLAAVAAWLALAVLVDAAIASGGAGTAASVPADPFGDTVTLLAHLSRLTEIAAIAVLPWLVAGEGAHRHRGGLAFGMGAVALAALVSAAQLTDHLGGAGEAARGGWTTGLVFAPLVGALASMVAAAVVLVRRGIRAPKHEREALVWFGAGVVLLVLSYARLAAPEVEALAVTADAMFVIAQGLLPVGILAVVAPTRNASAEPAGPGARAVAAISWALATAFAVSAYLVVFALGRAAGLEPVAAGAIAGGSLALVLGAGIRAIRSRLERLLRVGRPDARAVLARVGAGTGDVRGIAASLRDAWAVSSVEVTIGPSTTIAEGTPGNHRIATQLLAAGQHTGTLEVTADDREHLEAVVRPVLEQTAGLVSAAVQLAQINAEVAATRVRTLEARREERRLLHARLHDQLAPALAGIRFGMSAVDSRLRRGDPAVDEALTELRASVAACTEDVRALARSFLPVALDRGDLEAALDDLSRSVAADGIRLAVSAASVDDVPSDLQLGIYLLVADATAAAQRTRTARLVEVTVAHDGERTRLRIVVDADADDREAVGAVIVGRLAELGAGSVVRAGAAEAVWGG